jgi:hypothetical protein
MAARKNLQYPERVRERIRTGKLLRRLQKFALGEKGDHNEEVNLSSVQVKAIEVLLRKKLPDLTAVEHSGEVGQRDVTDKPLTEEQWAEQYERPVN